MKTMSWAMNIWQKISGDISTMSFIILLVIIVGTESTDMSRFPRVPRLGYHIEKTRDCTDTDGTLDPDNFIAQCGSDSAYPYVELWNCSYFCCVDVESSSTISAMLHNAVDYVNCGNEIYAAKATRDYEQGGY